MHAVSPRDDQEGGARHHDHHHDHHHPERGHDGDHHVDGDNDHDGFVDDCVLNFCISKKSFEVSSLFLVVVFSPIYQYCSTFVDKQKESARCVCFLKHAFDEW